MEQEKIKSLEQFAEQIVDDVLSEPEIREAMERFGLPFTEDKVERLNLILKALHPIQEEALNEEFK